MNEVLTTGEVIFPFDQEDVDKIDCWLDRHTKKCDCIAPSGWFRDIFAMDGIGRNISGTKCNRALFIVLVCPECGMSELFSATAILGSTRVLEILYGSRSTRSPSTI